MNALFILGLFFLSCISEKKVQYTGSTPPHSLIRTFLRIPADDSIDFIRWHLWMNDKKEFRITANYGIGKPNTSGFYDGGNHVQIQGTFEQKKNTYTLRSGNHAVTLLIINDDLLHFLDNDHHLLIGNGGWSFTLNNTTSKNQSVTIPAHLIQIRDSLAFHGRTPCGIPTITSHGHPCNKLKWYVRLYSNGKNRGTYKLDGTAWRTDGTRTGEWYITSTANGQQLIILNDKQGQSFLHLLLVDENIAIFVNSSGHAFVGDKDFSYTLNRR